MTGVEKFLEDVAGTLRGASRYPPDREQLERLLNMTRRLRTELERAMDVMDDLLATEAITKALDYDGR